MGNAVPVGHVLLLSILIISCANQIGAAFPEGDDEPKTELAPAVVLPPQEVARGRGGDD